MDMKNAIGKKNQESISSSGGTKTLNSSVQGSKLETGRIRFGNWKMGGVAGAQVQRKLRKSIGIF